MYQKGIIAAENRIAQQENLALWLVKDGRSPWLWVVPDDVRVSHEDGVTFLECDRTWVAIRTLGGTVLVPDQALSATLSETGNSRFPGHQVLSANGQSEGYCGLAIEVGEKESHSSFAKFKQVVRGAEVDTDELVKGVVRYRSSDGKWLGIHWNDDPLDLGVWRNGKRRDLAAAALYESPIIKAPWGGGSLEVNSGGDSFHCEVDDDGRTSFSTSP